ncbi:hypothetical protein ACLLO4_34350 [Kutzneria viridogrisea]|uniref:hypothetical protein n=1 Tax=Kutzneria viridogrisea TaxID=47990 RepID=UPI0015FFC4D9
MPRAVVEGFRADLEHLDGTLLPIARTAVLAMSPGSAGQRLIAVQRHLVLRGAFDAARTDLVAAGTELEPRDWRAGRTAWPPGP